MVRGSIVLSPARSESGHLTTANDNNNQGPSSPSVWQWTGWNCQPQEEDPTARGQTLQGLFFGRTPSPRSPHFLQAGCEAAAHLVLGPGPVPWEPRDGCACPAVEVEGSSSRPDLEIALLLLASCNPPVQCVPPPRPQLAHPCPSQSRIRNGLRDRLALRTRPRPITSVAIRL